MFCSGTEGDRNQTVRGPAKAGIRRRKIAVQNQPRIAAGTQFDFQLVYNLESNEDFEEDMTVLQDGFRLLQLDYLGGHGSRGYGRVAFSDFNVKKIDVRTGKVELDKDLAERFGRGCL